jgi:nucleoside-diphosphate-sugar epimerase
MLNGEWCMRVFLTGGAGYIGSAVLDAFVRGGHQVDAVVRNTVRAAEVQARGATPVLGDLAEPASYADAAAATDVIVHTALEESPRKIDVDATVIRTLLDAAAASKSVRVFIYTSGVWVIGPSPSPADETTRLDPAEYSAWRVAHERRVLDAASDRLRTAVIRPGIVYGGTRGIVGDVLKDAANSLIRVVGPGTNRWPLVYDRDLADLYLRVATSPDASGVFHATDEGDETVNEIVAAVSEHAPTRPSIRYVPLAEARKKLGPYADALALDQVIRSPRARALGWTPAMKSVARNAARLMDEWRRGAAG